MSRYQDIYDGMEAGRKLLRDARRKMDWDRVAELNIEIEAVEHAMDQELFRSRWETLKAISVRLSHERENLLRKI